MNMIVAADANWGIGNKNSLLVKIPRDQKYFREVTTGKVVIMGRKTLQDALIEAENAYILEENTRLL